MSIGPEVLRKMIKCPDCHNLICSNVIGQTVFFCPHCCKEWRIEQ